MLTLIWILGACPGGICPDLTCPGVHCSTLISRDHLLLIGYRLLHQSLTWKTPPYLASQTELMFLSFQNCIWTEAKLMHENSWTIAFSLAYPPAKFWIFPRLSFGEPASSPCPPSIHEHARNQGLLSMGQGTGMRMSWMLEKQLR